MSPSSSQYPAIPQKLWEYFERFIKEKPNHKLIEAIKKQGYDKTWRGINAVFNNASQATGMPPDKLYEEIRFNQNDFADNNFQALLGVLRAINILNDQGFHDLKPLRPMKSQKEVDLLGRFNKKFLAIEVIRSSEKKYSFPEHKKSGSNSLIHIAGRYTEKRSQLDTSILHHGCEGGMLMVVMDSQPIKALVSHQELEQLTQEAFEAIGSPAETYLSIFTGMADESGKNILTIYPPMA